MKNNIFVKTQLIPWRFFKSALSIDGTIIGNKLVKELDCAIDL